jgi:hypothetical protein
VKTRDKDTNPGGRAGLAPTLFYLLFGPVVWAVHLTIIYGAHTLVCARAPGVRVLGLDATVLIVIVTTVVALALLPLSVLAWRVHPAAGISDGERFYPRLMTLLAVLSACGIVWAGAAALIVAPCVALR